MLLLSAAGLLPGCYDKEHTQVSGKKPVYLSYEELIFFEQQPPQPVENAGKVLVYNNFLFLGEVNRGIHIIDIADTLNPVKISFLAVPGNRDMVAQNNLLYADNGPHLLVIDIQNIQNVTLQQRKLNWFLPSEFLPPSFEGYFDCADYSKGWLVDWEDAQLLNPKCKR